MSGLLPPERSSAEKTQRLVRGVGAAAALVALTVLSMQLASRLIDAPEGETERAEQGPEATPPEATPPEATPPEARPEPEALPQARLDAPKEEPEVTAPEEEPEAVALRVTAIEPVRLRVELDGVEAYSGVMCTRGDPDCPSATLEFPPARVTRVKLADLTRAKILYKGTRVEPLGNLSAGRTLVFIED